MQAVRLCAGVTLAVSVLLLAGRVDAACNRPDIEFAVPPDGATEVPPNAKLFARYKSNAEYTGEEISVEQLGGSSQALTGEWSAPETLLSVLPVLEPGESYTVTWPRLRGINSANLGRAKEVDFTVGATTDEEPPLFEGLAGVSWDVDRERDDCTDSLEDRYVFDFDLGDLSDDGGRESLMIALFQTKGPNVKSSAPEPVSVQRMPAEGKALRLKRTMSDGEGDLCFAAVARDLTGKVSASGAKEVCTQTVAPPFFNGCSAAPASTRGGFAALIVMLVASAASFRRGRRGRRGRR